MAKNSGHSDSKQSGSGRFTLGRQAFARVSAVEGLHLSKTVAGEFARFDKEGLSPRQRRDALGGRFAKNAD